jgi:hypothetical protein
MRVENGDQVSGVRGQRGAEPAELTRLPRRSEDGPKRVGGVGDGLVSWLVMRFQARIFPWIAAAALVFTACARVDAQSADPNGSQSGSQNGSQNGTPNGAGSSSSQSSVAPPSDQAPSTTPYISVNPLANVRYDNRFDVSLAMAYDHMKAGPNILEGANLGGLDLSGSLWLTRHWGAEGSIRA